MDIATAPSTPDNAKSPPIIRRAFTAPTRSADYPRVLTPISDPQAQGAETLFAQDRCRIVSFSCGVKRPRSSGSSHNDRLDEPVGVFPWASLTERTIAAGPLRIYRVLEIAFLNTGSILRPILPKSQCWCVDGEAKFVLKVGPDAYYRVELPTTTEEEHQKAETLKGVLAKLLQYEVTACPFKRGFTVDLPEPPATPIRKRPWKPRRASHSTTHRASAPDAESGLTEGEPATRDNSDREYRNANTGESSQSEGADEDKTASRISTAVTQENIDSSEAADDLGDMPAALFVPGDDDLDELKTPTRPKPLSIGRAITAPPQLSLRLIPRSNPTPTIPIPLKQEKDSSSISSSMDSFHSFHSPISPLPPSPPYTDPSSSPLLLAEDDTLSIAKTRIHKRDISEATLTSSTPPEWMVTPTPTAPSNPSLPQTPPLTNDTASQPITSPITPSPRTQLRRRRSQRSCQRSTSPLATPTTLYSPHTRLSGHHLTTAILQKTFALLLGPPVQLVALMLNIARKIANGSYREFAFEHGAEGQRIPCSWDFSDAETEESAWEEDDFGVLIKATPIVQDKVRRGKGKEVGGSWEID